MGPFNIIKSSISVTDITGERHGVQQTYDMIFRDDHDEERVI